jgi:signal transduction histidine kinase
MTTPLIIGCLWVIAAAATAMLPMKRQMLPGVALLIAAPILLIWIGWVHGWLWVAVGTFAFLSMFRNPLLYFARRAMGKPADLPPELRR